MTWLKPLSLISALTALAAGSVEAGENGSSALNAEAQTCASCGPGFIPGSAPGYCIKVQERLRVQPDARRAMSPFAESYGFESMRSPDGTVPAHVRLNGGFGRQ